MTSTLTSACPLCGLRYDSKPLLELHMGEDHRQRRHAQPGRRDPGGTGDPRRLAAQHADPAWTSGRPAP
jgi:hypothetical protein